MAVMREVLDQEISKFIDRSAIPRIPFCEMHGENSLEVPLIKWDQSVFSDAPDVTQKLSGVRGQQNAGMQAVLIQNTRHLDVSIARGRISIV